MDGVISAGRAEDLKGRQLGPTKTVLYGSLKKKVSDS
jgi:hypothetical protein